MNNNIFDDFCPHCVHYDETTGVCYEIHHNVRSYPKKFLKNCNGELYVNDPEKNIEKNVEEKLISKRKVIDYDFFCDRCKHKDFDLQKGVLCGLTNMKPAFEDDCKDFVLDPEKGKQAANKKKIHSSYLDSKESTEEDTLTPLSHVLLTLSIIGFFFAGPGWYLTHRGSQIFGGILLVITGITVLFYMAVRPKWRLFLSYLIAAILSRLSYFLLSTIFGNP